MAGAAAEAGTLATDVAIAPLQGQSESGPRDRREARQLRSLVRSNLRTRDAEKSRTHVDNTSGALSTRIARKVKRACEKQPPFFSPHAPPAFMRKSASTHCQCRSSSPIATQQRRFRWNAIEALARARSVPAPCALTMRYCTVCEIDRALRTDCSILSHSPAQWNAAARARAPPPAAVPESAMFTCLVAVQAEYQQAAGPQEIDPFLSCKPCACVSRPQQQRGCRGQPTGEAEAK